MKHKQTLIAMMGLAALGLTVCSVEATEGGGGAYGNGSEGSMTGALPPPGMYLLNYTEYYHADSFKGGNGSSEPFDFHLTAFADAVRFVNVTPITILGANWAQHIVVPVVYEDVKTDMRGPTMNQHRTGMGDVDVDPFILGFHKPPFHWILGLDTYVPIGRYDPSDLDNISRNYWTFEPVAAVTYLNEGGQELSTKMMYDFNTENHDTDYTSGQEFHADFMAGQHLGAWTLGAGGSWYHQTTDDKQFGNKVGFQGRQMALGPQVGYQFKGVSIALSYDREFATENRPQGDKLWLKLVVPL